jgi:type I restriction enzyme, S subunit
MSNGYPLRPLGEVMRLDIQRTPMMPANTYRLAGVLNAGQGLIAKGEFDGGDTEYAAMNVLRVDQVVMRKLTAWEGPITVVPSEFDGCVVSSEFPTFTLGPDLVPDWMRHVCRSPRLWAEMKNRVRGTVQRRKRLNPEQLLRIQLPIPPREVQARIVEMLDAVDDHVAALESEADSLLRVRNAALADLLSSGCEGWHSVPLSDAGMLVRGRRFVKSDYVESGLGCIHYGQIYTDYGASAKRTVTYLPESFRASMSLAHPNDVVIAGTSENVEDVGKAVAWLGDDDVAVHDDCFIFRHDLDPKFVSYFEQWSRPVDQDLLSGF